MANRNSKSPFISADNPKNTSFNGAFWIILAPNLCSYQFLLVLFAGTITESHVLKSFRWPSRRVTHGHAGLWATPQLPLYSTRLKEMILKTLFKSHWNPKAPEVCRLGFVWLSKEWLHWVSAWLVSPSWAPCLSSVRMWGMFAKARFVSLLRNPQKSKLLS